jgi:cell division protease FtsH
LKGKTERRERVPVGGKQPPQRDHAIALIIGYFAISLLLGSLLQHFVTAPLVSDGREIPYGEFKAELKQGQVVEVTIGKPRVTGRMKSAAGAAGKQETLVFTTVSPPDGDARLLEDLAAAGVTYGASAPAGSVGGHVLSWLLPMAVFAALWYVASARVGRGAGGLFGVAKSKAIEVKPEDVGVTYKDVGGADEAIAELREIIQFLQTPERFARLGGRIPKGVLLVGPPGTGKTLVAKATAGEARVPFFETSGAEFVEMFVGVGAARVRDLFEQARRAAPAVVFIDEIDAIGQRRGAAVRVVANDEREQTLNQLLAEIDGFKTDAGRPVIIMAATNRPEVLDPALLRAGRFDRQVALGNPDLIGRIEILRIHTRKIKLAATFDLERAARLTPGFSGADLANVVNEAALLAARRNAEAVSLVDFEAAMERILAGLENRTRVMNEKERRAVASHECGHALVAHLVPHADPVGKVSIVPRSRGALGYTLQMPTQDRYLLTFEELEDRLAVMMGGRAAEKLMLSTISTGATDDIQHATDLARRMVTEYGMSEKLGSVRYAGRELQYLGGVLPDTSPLSPQTQEAVDAEVQRLVAEQYARAQALLAAHRPALANLTEQLLKSETLDGSAVKAAVSAPQAALGDPVSAA